MAVRGNGASHNRKVLAIFETLVVKKDKKMEVKSNQVDASKNGASFAPALDLRSTYARPLRFPTIQTCPRPCPSRHRCVQRLAQSIAISGVPPQQHFQVRFVHLKRRCHLFILLDTAGDPPILLGIALFPESRFTLLRLCKAFRQKIRKDALEQRSVAEEEVFKNNLKLGREIADFLRKNVVQAERMPVQPEEENTETYSTCSILFYIARISYWASRNTHYGTYRAW